MSQTLKEKFHKKIYDKVAFDKIEEEKIETLKKGTFEALANLAITHSDGLIMASENLPKEVTDKIEESAKPQLDYSASKEEATLIDFYTNQI